MNKNNDHHVEDEEDEEEEEEEDEDELNHVGLNLQNNKLSDGEEEVVIEEL